MNCRMKRIDRAASRHRWMLATLAGLMPAVAHLLSSPGQSVRSSPAPRGTPKGWKTNCGDEHSPPSVRCRTSPLLISQTLYEAFHRNAGNVSLVRHRDVFVQPNIWHFNGEKIPAARHRPAKALHPEPAHSRSVQDSPSAFYARNILLQAGRWLSLIFRFSRHGLCRSPGERDWRRRRRFENGWLSNFRLLDSCPWV